MSDAFFDPAFGRLVVGEASLIASEGRCMVVSTAIDVFGRMGDMEHLVEENVFYDVRRYFAIVERSADSDGLVR